MKLSALEAIEAAKQNKAWKLDLRYCKLTKLPEQLKELTWLGNLDARSNQFQDISVLQHLINLQFLDLGSNQIEDISALRHLTRLRFLRLSRNQIKNVEGLQYLTNLECLDLSSNQIENIEPLVPLFRLNKMQIGPEVDFYFHTGEVSLRSNPLKHPPMEIITFQGNKGIIEYFEKMTKC